MNDYPRLNATARMRHQLMGDVIRRVLGLQPGGAVQGLIAWPLGITAALQAQTTAQQNQLEALMLTGVDFKAAGHGVQLLGVGYQQDSPAGSERQPAGTVP